MSYRSIIKWGLLLCAGHALLLAAGQPETKWKWSELSPIVTDHKVALVLPAGTEIEGKVLSVEPDGLRLRVTRTSDRNAVGKGERLIPRQSVSVLRLTEYRKMARLLCTLGAVAIAGLVVASQDIDVYEGPAVIIVPAVTAVGTAGAGVAGYFIGKRIDKKVLYIRVAPEG